MSGEDPRSVTDRAPRGHIRALTGIRIVAAVWVVFFHIRGNLASEFPGLYRVIGPVIDHGELGVDLFFALSGFVLALNYTQRMGWRLERPKISAFLWARLARVWPVFFLTLLLAGLWHGYLMGTGQGDPVPPRDFSVTSFLSQALLIDLWNKPEFDRLLWNGPAWSVSAEAFAYVLFPVLALLFLRVGRVVSVRMTVVLAVVATLPISLFVGAFGTMYFDWAWMLRIVCGFTAGALMHEAVRRIPSTARVRTWASHLALALIVAVVAATYVFDAAGYSHLVPMLAPLFVVLVGSLALGDRHVVRLLGTRGFVVGGAASYSVYMIHMLVIEPFWWMQGNVPQYFAPGSTGSKVGFLVLPMIIVALGYVMWRFFEEPMRRAMRDMSRVGRAPRDNPPTSNDLPIGKEEVHSASTPVLQGADNV